uniref:C-type lectin domain-containing protein n=1 Tax=Branchiostoma floridae TaxID=7739 RepID=C3ZIS8_BRAFL|eukprot:XP_002591518.1 hypothetical protein BRAFLDRAFT_247247 [Branchiostoma floridae]
MFIVTGIAVCPLGYTGYGGACFKVFTERQTYSGARQVCADDGGFLAMPKNNGLFVFLWDLKNDIDPNLGPWIGLNDENRESEWMWEDGTVSNITADWSKWSDGEPNNANGVEDCVRYISLWQEWNDQACSIANTFFCQLDKGTSRIIYRYRWNR